jgi:hypothetical protein
MVEGRRVGEGAVDDTSTPTCHPAARSINMISKSSHSILERLMLML